MINLKIQYEITKNVVLYCVFLCRLNVFIAFFTKMSENRRKVDGNEQRAAGRGKNMKGLMKKGIAKFENSFFSRVVKRALGMMIPLVLTGGLACAVRSLPIPGYQELMTGTIGYAWYSFLTLIYKGTFGIFSVALAITLAYSYAMERNESQETGIMYVIVVLAAFGAQLNVGTDYFDAQGMGVNGCFAALFVGYLACKAYTVLRKSRFLRLERYTSGMGEICALAIQTFFPLMIIVALSAVINLIVGRITGIYGCYRLFNKYLFYLFRNISAHSNFLSGFLYTFVVNLMWFFGLHGSHILESVAVNNFKVTGDVIFSKAFYDIFVGMGGCGTTMCVLIALLLFFRKERTGKLAGLAAGTVIFNLNEMLTFGIPIILNPVLFLPFVLTPVLAYCIAYGATVVGFLPVMTREVAWSVPVGFGGYLATGSWRGIAVQAVILAVGTALYYPFLKYNQRMEVERAKDQVQVLIRELQEKEEMIEAPAFLNRGDHIGTISRMLLNDLKLAIRQKKLYMLYQPQVYRDGTCIGAEALLRWKHPVYGMIYPSLIIYLAEEGKILPDLEKFILDEVISGIGEIGRQYDSDFKVSVNLTAHSLLWDIEDYMQQELKKYQVDPRMLWIEITEQDILLQTDLVKRKLNGFKESGHKLLIDDFGMGHTSLLYLQSEYFDVVKLDGSLTRPLLENETNQKIVRSIIELGGELGVNVIAEYVENDEQQKLLEKLGCYCYQGYLYAPPLELQKFITYMKDVNHNFK